MWVKSLEFSLKDNIIKRGECIWFVAFFLRNPQKNGGCKKKNIEKFAGIKNNAYLCTRNSVRAVMQ